MIYLKKIHLYDEAWESSHFQNVNSTTADEYYPLNLFSLKLNRLDFEDITILYGGNGSGKTTLLNIIAEKLRLIRKTKYTRTEMFDFFVQNSTCQTETKSIPPKSKILASDDIFDNILNVRNENSILKEKKLHANDDIPKIKNIDLSNPDIVNSFLLQSESRKLTQRKFIIKQIGHLKRQYSNGENALIYFNQQIESDALYLLDEPENSLSPEYQLELKMLIEDSTKYKNCQFIIATHSPFMLALKDAKIYNIDNSPVTVERWYKLENIRIYFDFFKKYEDLFNSKF